MCEVGRSCRYACVAALRWAWYNQHCENACSMRCLNCTYSGYTKAMFSRGSASSLITSRQVWSPSGNMSVSNAQPKRLLTFIANATLLSVCLLEEVIRHKPKISSIYIQQIRYCPTGMLLRQSYSDQDSLKLS